jgi:hypothetical protein
MGDKIMAQQEKPFLRYALSFRDPLFNLEELDSKAAKAAFSAFRPWNVSLENVTFKDDAKNLAEEATNFLLLGGRVTFSITPGGCNLGVVNANWSDTDMIIQIARAGTEAVLNAMGVSVDKQLVSITMHLHPSYGSVGNITSRFVQVDANALFGSPAQCMDSQFIRTICFGWWTGRGCFRMLSS